jgi:transcriptional regulator with XRE-family HTH domain
MTQEELAKRAGYTSRSSINKIELGLTDIPQKKLALIAQALCVSPSYLLGLEGEDKKETPPASEVSEDERRFQELLAEIEKIFRQMSREDQQLYLALLRRGLGKS